MYKMTCSNAIYIHLLYCVTFFETFDNSLGLLYFHYSSIKIQHDCYLNDFSRYVPTSDIVIGFRIIIVG